MAHSDPFARLDLADYRLPRAIEERLLSPALVVYIDRVRENLRRMIAYAGTSDRWRPHVKTTKIPDVWTELVAAGLRNFKCATTREAQCLLGVLEGSGTTQADLLVAYPLVGPSLRVLGQLAERHPGVRVSVLCEDPEHVRSIPPSLSVFVDVNPGMHRTGIPISERALIQAVARTAGRRFRGVHYYDGHLHAGTPQERRDAVFACYAPLLDLCDALAREGSAVEEVITSGTPTFLHALRFARFDGADFRHRISPGTVVYHDLRSEEENPGLDLVPAALVRARVVSHPSDGIVTCDAGSKSIAAEAGDPCAAVLGHPELEALTPSEEHLPLRVHGPRRPERGETLLLVPRHVCPTVNLAEEALLVDGDEARVASVRARAHDLLAAPLA